MRKKRSLALILIIAMVFCLMPVAFAGRAEAAESLVAYEAYKIYGIRDAADKETESFQSRITVIVDPNTMKADVTFKRTDQYGKPLDYEKIKDDDAYQEHKDFFDQNYGHMTCDVKDMRAEHEASIKEQYKDKPEELEKYNGMYDGGKSCYWYLENFNWDTDPFLLYDEETPVNGYIKICRYYKDMGYSMRVLQLASYVAFGQGAQSGGKMIYASQKYIFEDIEVPETPEPIEKKTYTIEKDDFSFVNDDTGFPTAEGISAPGIANFGGKFRSGTYGYMLDVATYSAMIKSLKNSRIAALNYDLNEKFQGACYGMSATSGLIFDNKIGLNQVGGTSASATTYSLQSPKKGNDALLKTLLYYQIYGNFEKGDYLYKRSNGGEPLSQVVGRAQNLAKALEANPNEPQLTGIVFYDRNMNRYYHAVLAYKAEKYDGDKYDYDILIYDPNSPGEVKHLYVYPDGTEWENAYIPSYGGVFVRYFRPVTDVYNAKLTYPVPAVKQLRIETTGGLTVTNGSNTATIQNGAVTRGAVAASYDGTVERGAAGDWDVYVEQEYGSGVTDIIISNMSNDPLTIESLGGKSTYTSVQTSDSFVAASGGITEFTLNTDGSVSAKTDGSEGTVAVAEDKTTGDLFGTTVTTKAKETTITPKASGSDVKTSDGTAKILLSGATDGVTFENIDATDGVEIRTSGKNATVSADGKEVAKGTADENGGSAQEPEDPDPDPEPDPEPGPGEDDPEALLLEIPKNFYYRGDGNMVYRGKIEAVTESGYTYNTLNNYNAVSSYIPVGYCLEDFDNDGEKELLSVYIGSSNREVQLTMKKVVDGEVVTKALQSFEGLKVIHQKADRAQFDVFLIERNGKKYICLESDGFNDFFEEGVISEFLMLSYDPDESGIKKFKEEISHSWDTDYFYDGMGSEIQNQLSNYGIYIDGDSYVSGNSRVIDSVSKKQIICGARTLPTHPAVTVDLHLDYYALKDGDDFTSISFYNTNDLSERNKPGYLYRMYNRLTGEHFYTTNREEKMYLMQIGWSYEGILCEVPEKSNTPVYRLYNPNSGEHHYTPAVSEKNMLVGVGWRYEGIGWYSDDSKKIPIHRLYNPNAKGIYEAGSHHYTSNESEAVYLNSIGWRREGEGWYGSREVIVFY